MVLSITCSHIKVVYNPKTFFPHAVSLDQGFPHCPIFSAAASRRSLDRVSVPVLGVALSRPLPVIALVSHYLTNKLIGRRPIQFRLATLPLRDYRILAYLSIGYLRELGMFLRVTNPFAAKHLTYCYARYSARLACLIHIASVHPDPSSNSQKK